jgi:uncharacterized protein (TIGR03067 family)
MRVRVVVALIALVGLTAFTPAPFPRKDQRAREVLDLKGLQGYWRVEKAERTTNGTYTVVPDPVTHILIENDVWVFMHGRGNRSNEYRILVDPTRKPVWFTFRNKTQNTGGTDGLMIRLPDGRVKILYQWGGGRPASFEKPPANYWALTLIREK